MTPGLLPGQTAELCIVVTPETCPHFDGKLVHPVYATWELVHQMEVAGRKLLEPHLEPHEEGMGVHISVDHKSPALLGSTVTIRAVVETCTPNKLTCRTSAACEGRVLATGCFVQAIIPKSKLAEILARNRPSARA